MRDAERAGKAKDPQLSAVSLFTFYLYFYYSGLSWVKRTFTF